MRHFSLQINKRAIGGEGGPVVIADPELHRRIEALHNAEPRRIHKLQRLVWRCACGWGDTAEG